MKKAKEIFSGILFCAMEALVGILLLIDPVAFTSGIIMAAGIVLTVWGAINIIKYFRLDAEEAALSQDMAKGLAQLALGVFCMFRGDWFITAFPLLAIVYGIATLLTGFGKVQWAFDMFRQKKAKWFLLLISAIVSVVCAFIIMSNPFTSTVALWMFTAISLIVEAFFDLVALFLNDHTPVKEEPAVCDEVDGAAVNTEEDQIAEEKNADVESSV